MVCFDGWYSSLDNLKLVRSFNWNWLTRFRSNRIVSPQPHQPCSIDSLNVPEQGLVVHLQGYGLVRVFRIDSTNGNTDYWATNVLEMTDLERIGYAQKSWTIETYHRAIKQFCGIERCHARLRIAQLNHIGFALRAFLRLERYCWKKGISWFEAKRQLLRDAIRQYLSKPIYQLPNTA